MSTTLHATADLDIVLLRPGPPGHILRGGGDIDNRLKTLLDALKMPEANALPPGAAPGAGEDPFYCLLEDDKLVTSIRMETDRFLDAANEREVLLVIHVITKYTEAILGQRRTLVCIEANFGLDTRDANRFWIEQITKVHDYWSGQQQPRSL